MKRFALALALILAPIAAALAAPVLGADGKCAETTATFDAFLVGKQFLVVKMTDKAKIDQFVLSAASKIGTPPADWDIRLVEFVRPPDSLLVTIRAADADGCTLGVAHADIGTLADLGVDLSRGG